MMAKKHRDSTALLSLGFAQQTFATYSDPRDAARNRVRSHIRCKCQQISAIASLLNKSESPSDNNPIRADAVLFEFIDDRK